jgi:hypothetical protein
MVGAVEKDATLELVSYVFGRVERTEQGSIPPLPEPRIPEHVCCVCS